MTPLQFAQTYEHEWSELETLLTAAASGRRGLVARHADDRSQDGARLTALYRRACGQLALARARAYPSYIVERLERLAADGHQLVYQNRDVSWRAFVSMAVSTVPVTARAQASYVLLSAAAFVVPMVVMGLLVYWRSDLILSMVSADTAASFEDMYSPANASIGRTRTATTDWMMFGYYIRNNVGVAFQCYAGGLFAGVGSLFYLAYNGAFTGALAGFLVDRGLSGTFFSFVATHSAFELTAIVLSGAAGLRLGHGFIARGRHTRTAAVVLAARESVTLLYGAAVMLLVAAGVEAFWSSARWIPVGIKYSVAAVCWCAVLAYLLFQGRRAD